MADLVSYDELTDAQGALTPILRATPSTLAEWASGLAERPIWLKPEHTQRTGSYKVRGSYNLIHRLQPGVEVVAASAGNHAQGVALAARTTGHKATVFMPATASLPKVQATRDYGADVHLEGSSVDDALELARIYARQHEAEFVPPFDNRFVIAGQGTIGLEILNEVADVETIVVPIGGGGLISGVASAAKLSRPEIRVVGVQAEGAASMLAAREAGEPVSLKSTSTIADGIAVKCAGEITFAHVQKYVDELVTVSDGEIAAAILLLLERHKAVVEPAGAVGLAALLSGKIGGTGTAATVLSGGNVDPLLLMRLIEYGMGAAGRYLVVRVKLYDRPGQLASLSRVIGDLGLNVIEVDHHRRGLNLAVGEAEIRITVETRGLEHRATVVPALRTAGFDAEEMS